MICREKRHKREGRGVRCPPARGVAFSAPEDDDDGSASAKGFVGAGRRCGGSRTPPDEGPRESAVAPREFAASAAPFTAVARARRGVGWGTRRGTSPSDGKAPSSVEGRPSSYGAAWSSNGVARPSEGVAMLFEGQAGLSNALAREQVSFLAVLRRRTVSMRRTGAVARRRVASLRGTSAPVPRRTATDRAKCRRQETKDGFPASARGGSPWERRASPRDNRVRPSKSLGLLTASLRADLT